MTGKDATAPDEGPRLDVIWQTGNDTLAKAHRAPERATAEGRCKPNRTAFVRANGGWFGSDNKAPPLPRDERVIDEEAEAGYVGALSRNGFFGPDSWHLNGEANAAYALRARANWRLTMPTPTQFLHGPYDYTCETIDSRLAEPMRASCADLTESVVPSGHWMAQEKPAYVNAALAERLARKRPDLWLRA